ncbi:MAG: (d)CMP kinase [Bacteroidota bacterium]
MRKIVIAIDGHSSTGKSTVAKRLAKALKYVYVDTGAMYRAVTLHALQSGFIQDNSHDFDALINALDTIQLRFVYNPNSGASEMHLNNKNVERQIRTLEVSKYVSQVAAIPEVRKKLVEQQQNMGEEKGVVMDGRDIGTVVFPDAELKFFMTAMPEKRANRRFKELLERGERVTYEEVLKNIMERDKLDSSRAVAPLVKAEDAIPFNNSDMSPEEQFQRILDKSLEVIAT